jgi:hypothetical protein
MTLQDIGSDASASPYADHGLGMSHVRYVGETLLIALMADEDYVAEVPFGGSSMSFPSDGGPTGIAPNDGDWGDRNDHSGGQRADP